MYVFIFWRKHKHDQWFEAYIAQTVLTMPESVIYCEIESYIKAIFIDIWIMGHVFVHIYVLQETQYLLLVWCRSHQG